MQHETWTVTKAATRSRGGIVAAQHHLGAEAGAAILARGGNAVDAAVATALALAVVEPWMSGLGGGGFLVFGEARSGAVHAIDFASAAPARLDPSRYPIVGERGPSAFGWPKVLDDRNTRGGEAVCVPGAIAGFALAAERFGRLPFADLIAPAIELAERGLPVDWHATLIIALSARELAGDPGARAILLRDGVAPSAGEGAPVMHLPLPALATTLRRLAEAGPRDFYEGAIARDLVAELGAAGSAIDASDLRNYRARLAEPVRRRYRGVDVLVPGGISGGPALHAILAMLETRLVAGRVGSPEAEDYLAHAEATRDVFADRFNHEGDFPPQAHTTHLSVVDREGNLVSLTNTLGAYFGAKLVLPRSGVAMNNSMSNFDPVPGKPNSFAAGRRPLYNMAPTILRDGTRCFAALGACGGRKIVPTVAQLVTWIVDFGMDLERAFATPRIDPSGPRVLVDAALPEPVRAALALRVPIENVTRLLSPNPFATPAAVMRGIDGVHQGMAHVHSPIAGAIAASI
jgi:gamma-glutamyltranspeptidase/glutathione hydrolase